MTNKLVLACLVIACGDDTQNAPGPLSDGSVTVADGGGGDTAPEACLGSALLSYLGKSTLLAGGSMADATAAAAPIDGRYVYLSGAFPDGAGPCVSCATGCTSQGGKSCANSGPGCAWWGCWQSDQPPPGAYVRDLLASYAKAGITPFLSYYTILQSSGVKEGAPEVTVTSDATYMTKFWGEWRFFLQQIGSAKALIHIEPDFWGYAEQMGSNPHQIPSVVGAVNADCATTEASIAGMGQCMIAMVRKYAPNARVGLHASASGTNIDVMANTDPNLDVAGEANKLATFLAEAGEKDADFVVVEASDRDAGYYQSTGRSSWWDATNATLPCFHQHFAWVKALTEALGKPAIDWQLPVGNMSQSDTTDHWKDNRVDYMFGHMGEVAGAHIVGVLFGAGATGQTTPESDGGNFINKVKAYAASGGQKLCP